MDNTRYQESKQENIMRNCIIIDTIIRAESNIDEQLHAGSYFYYLTSNTLFQSSNIYMYPIALCMIGYAFPISFNLLYKFLYFYLFISLMFI